MRYAVLFVALCVAAAANVLERQRVEGAVSAPGESAVWSRYVPKKERKDTVKRAVSGAGMGAMMSGRITAAIWMTDRVARVLVSEDIDAERLDATEAEKRYQRLRVPDKYAILIYADAIKGGGGPYGGYSSATAEELEGTLDTSRGFLQRRKNEKAFSRGEWMSERFPFRLGGRRYEKSFIVLFPKSMEQGEPLLPAIDQKLELIYFFLDKEIKLEFEPKKFAAALEEL